MNSTTQTTFITVDISRADARRILGERGWTVNGPMSAGPRYVSRTGEGFHQLDEAFRVALGIAVVA